MSDYLKVTEGSIQDSFQIESTGKKNCRHGSATVALSTIDDAVQKTVKSTVLTQEQKIDQGRALLGAAKKITDKFDNKCKSLWTKICLFFMSIFNKNAKVEFKQKLDQVHSALEQIKAEVAPLDNQGNFKELPFEGLSNEDLVNEFKDETLEQKKAERERRKDLAELPFSDIAEKAMKNQEEKKNAEQNKKAFSELPGNHLTKEGIARTFKAEKEVDYEGLNTLFAEPTKKKNIKHVTFNDNPVLCYQNPEARRIPNNDNPVLWYQNPDDKKNEVDKIEQKQQKRKEKLFKSIHEDLNNRRKGIAPAAGYYKAPNLFGDKKILNKDQREFESMFDVSDIPSISSNKDALFADTLLTPSSNKVSKKRTYNEAFESGNNVHNVRFVNFVE